MSNFKSSSLYKNLILIGVIFFVCLMTIETANAYNILTPASDKRLIIQARRATSNMVIEVASTDELARLRVEEVLNRNIDTRALTAVGQWENNGSTYVHYILPLKNGNNTFIVNPGDNEVKIYYRPLRTLLNVNVNDPKTFLFHRQEVVPAVCTTCHNQTLPDDANLDVKRLDKNSDYSPVCFSCHRKLIRQNLWLHSPSANVFCWTCHRQADGAGGTKVPLLSAKQVDENCFECHVNRQKFENDYVHGPVGTGECTVCHDPHGGEYEKQLWADGKADLCVGCHLNKKNVLKKTFGFFSHGILQGSGCIVCHNTHSEGYRFQLYNTINELCVSCHNGLQDVKKGHPVGNHPLEGKPDPLRKGRELSCTSCHNPHGTTYRYMLIGSILGGHVCSKCHR